MQSTPCLTMASMLNPCRARRRFFKVITPCTSSSVACKLVDGNAINVPLQDIFFRIVVVRHAPSSVMPRCHRCTHHPKPQRLKTETPAFDRSYVERQGIAGFGSHWASTFCKVLAELMRQCRPSRLASRDCGSWKTSSGQPCRPGNRSWDPGGRGTVYIIVSGLHLRGCVQRMTYLDVLGVTLLKDLLDHLVVDAGTKLVLKCGLGSGIVLALCTLPNSLS